MEHRGPQVGEADVAAFEARLGITLPADYRRFLLEVNGGRPSSENAQCLHLVITGLLSLADKDHEPNDLETCADWARWVLPHPDLLLIGNAMGAMILLAHTGSHRGEVWNLDTVDPRPVGANPRVLWHDQRDMTKLADSFEQFMRKLEPLKRVVPEP
jgi:hypothetical protein